MPLAGHRRVSQIDERFRGAAKLLEDGFMSSSAAVAPKPCLPRRDNSSHRQEFVDRCLSVLLAWPELCAREVYVIGRVRIMLRL